MRASNLALQTLLLPFALAPMAASAATETIAFVAEHIPEIAMDNRYATLPLWGGHDAPGPRQWQLGATAGYASTAAGGLELSGPLLALTVDRKLSNTWCTSMFGIFDDLEFSSGGLDSRPLDASISGGLPFATPVAGEFSELGGSTQHIGLGVAARQSTERRILGSFQWTAGVMWERIALHDYALRYRVADGPDVGASGRLHYSATYSFVTPFAGIAWPRDHGNWRSQPHVQLAMPLPRRGFVERIVADQLDVRSDSADIGDRPFGDPSVTLGWDITYRPWSLTVDVGSLLSQATLERYIHEGAGRNWLLSVAWVR